MFWLKKCESRPHILATEILLWCEGADIVWSSRGVGVVSVVVIVKVVEIGGWYWYRWRI